MINRNFLNTFFAAFFIILHTGCNYSSQTGPALRIDPDTVYQTIEGFGAFNTIRFWRDETYDNKYDLIANDLGLSILRLELPPTFQPEKGGEYDLNARVFGGPDLQQNFADVRGLHKHGVNKFIASIWSPPAWMKTLNKEGKGPTTILGGSLREDALQDFAEYCAGYCETFKKETGVDLYAIGLQNEPEFVEPYNSCVYNPEQVREALRAVGAEFRKRRITTKIYLPEVLPQQHHVDEFFNTINDDPETRNYADIFAIHNYDADGINVGGAGAREWEEFYRLANSVQPAKQLWMTETSGHANNWEGAMLLAANIYNALYYGNLNAWLWWAFGDTKKSEVYGILIDGQPTGRYNASKHYYKYVRPGAVRVKADTGDPGVLALAFKNSGEYPFVGILINKDSVTKEIHLPKLRNTARPEAYLSSEKEFWIFQKIEGNSRVSMPASSIMTIVWKNK